jgi:hypothetical protein
MQHFGRQLAALVLSMAVLLVSSTCTSAGCVLCALSGSSMPASAPRCCGQSLPTGHDGRQDCPLCRHSVLIGKTVENSVAPIVVPSCHTFVPATIASNAVAEHRFELRSSSGVDAPPSHVPSTLFALHCALLA